jgi:hypothetical protein
MLWAWSCRALAMKAQARGRGGNSRTKSGRWVWHHGHSEEAHLGGARASVQAESGSGVIGRTSMEGQWYSSE